MTTGTLIALGLYFATMLAIGLYAYRESEQSASGYMLGGRQLSPAVTALSAGASDMSGWLLMGLPGAMFVSGLSASWIAIGLIIGAWCNYLLVAPRLRVYTELANDAITIPDYFENRFEDNTRLLRVIASVVIVIFFTLYTSSGVVAGGKLFESAFHMSYETGLYVTAIVVVAYTLIGGFMAVSLTDFVQGILMFIALILVPIVVIFDLGGVASATTTLNDISPHMFSLFIDAKTGDTLSFIAIVSLMAWGLGYFGQPHIVVRFMAMKHPSDAPVARKIGMSWMILSMFGALATGLFGAAYTAKNGLTLDPETVFIYLSQVLLSPLIAGFLLAAILAAIMSTISSQLLVTSSSLTKDFYQVFLRKQATDKETVFVGRVAVALVAIVAIALAYDRESSILSLVGDAWAGFGAAFGPLVIFSLLSRTMSATAAIAGMIVGAATVLLWIYLPLTIDGRPLGSIIYAIVPGFIASSIAIALLTRFAPAKTSVVEKFDRYTTTMKNLH